LEVTNLTSGGNLVNTEVRQHDDDKNSEENLGISSKTFQDFTVNAMKEFETLKANIQAQSDQLAGKPDSKFKSEISNLSATITVQVENSYRILYEHLTFGTGVLHINFSTPCM
jgi:phage-related protein